MPSRSLPQVIGPTENALRALLRCILAATAIRGYEHWVALNATSGDAADEQIRSALQCSADRARNLIRELEEEGLVVRDSGAWRTTELGARELDGARGAVAHATARVVRDIDEEELAITISVLERVRVRAQDEAATY